MSFRWSPAREIEAAILAVDRDTDPDWDTSEINAAVMAVRDWCIANNRPQPRLAKILAAQRHSRGHSDFVATWTAEICRAIGAADVEANR